MAAGATDEIREKAKEVVYNISFKLRKARKRSFVLELSAPQL